MLPKDLTKDVKMLNHASKVLVDKLRALYYIEKLLQYK